MKQLPHHYSIAASASALSDVTLEGAGLSPLSSAPPAEFDGPGDRWSPETLIVAAVADCFVLTFRAVARLSKLPWTSITCNVVGTLDRIERATQFTDFLVRVRLRVPVGTEQEQAERLLVRAEQACLVSNSLKARPHLEASVDVESSALAS